MLALPTSPLRDPAASIVNHLRRPLLLILLAQRRQTGEWRLGEHAAGCEPDLVEDGSADRPLQVLDLESEHIIGTGQHHWQHFAHVPYDEL